MATTLDLPTLPFLPPAQALYLHPSGDYVSDVIRQTSDWFERPILDEIARRVTGGVLVDVGAHIGNHVVFMAERVPHSAIHAFEPLPANLVWLWGNVRPYPEVTIHPIALSDHGDVVGLISDLDNLGHTWVSDDGPVRVRTVPLDAYELQDVSLIKIDVEGHEAQVLAGARDTIARSHPLIVIEDWAGKGYDLPGYRLVAEWEKAHQTFMYEWAP